MKKIIIILLFLSISIFINNLYLSYKNYNSLSIENKKINENINKKLKTKKEFKNIIKLTWEWFINNQNVNFLKYEYNFKTKKYSDKHHSLREMWALWSITNLYDFLWDKRYKNLASKWISFFENYLICDKKNDFYYIDITPKKTKLWYSAFMILALIKSEHPKKDIYLKWLANWILYLQNNSWKIKTHFFINKETWIDYYPWEALLSLIKLYNYNKNEKYLNAIKNALHYYSFYFKRNKNTAFVPWQSRAFYELYKIEKSKKVANFIFEMNDYMLSRNNPRLECKNFNFPRWITTAVFTEWVIKAYKIAKDIGDKKRIYCYKNFIIEASNYISTLQITDTTDKKAYWWFKWSKNSSTMRVDRNQHASMALMEAYNLWLFDK